jgi:Phage tail protein (Tail_P2_I)
VYWTKEQLLAHLPYVYRERDAEIAARDGLAEGPLSSLLGAFAIQIGAVEESIEQLYDNWFVETCQPWVLPYIAELLGINRLPSTSFAVFTPRAFIANAMAGRRRKGTPGMLQQLARDSTGWNAHVVEYFQHLAQFQHLNRYRPAEFLVPDLRNPNALERLSSPFTSTNRLPEIRNIDGPYPGRFNIPNIGIHLWPLIALTPPASARFAIEARPDVQAATAAIWYLHPLGVPAPLFNRPPSSDPSAGAVVTALAGERDVPEPLRRVPLHLELERLRQSIADAAPAPPLRYFGEGRPAFLLFVNDETDPIPSAEIRIVDFSHGWPAPAATQAYRPSSGGPEVVLPIRCAVDPVRGQVAFASGAEPARLRSVHAYGFSAKMGSGPYDRLAERSDQEDVTFQLGVSRVLTPVADVIVGSLTEAVTAWNSQAPGTRGIICVMDSMRYTENVHIDVPAGSHLTLVAADWPAVETEPGIFERFPGVFSPDRIRAHVRGDIEVVGTAPAGHANPGSLRIDGLLVEGSLTVTPGHLGNLTLSHSTLSQSISIETSGGDRNPELRVLLQKSRVQRVQCPADLETITVEDCIIGSSQVPETPAINAQDAALDLKRSTFWGPVACREVEASDCIFMRKVVVERTQVGCVRYSYLAPGSKVPRPFRCQPQLAIGAETNLAAREMIGRQVRPLFESIDPAHPAYARLHTHGPEEIRRGGENHTEMGAFAALETPLREDFLRGNLDEFLRAGLVAGLRYEMPV